MIEVGITVMTDHGTRMEVQVVDIEGVETVEFPACSRVRMGISEWHEFKDAVDALLLRRDESKDGGQQ